MEESLERCIIIIGNDPDELEIEYVKWQQGVLSEIEKNLGLGIVKRQFRPVVNYHGLFTRFAVAVFWHISKEASRAIERCKVFTGNNSDEVNEKYLDWQRGELRTINTNLGLEIVKRQFRTAVNHLGDFTGFAVAVFWRVEGVPKDALVLDDLEEPDDSIDVEI